jgi:hypothetical protein
MFRLPLSDACRLEQGRDAPIPWRALFEPCELGRPPKTRVRPIQCGQTGRHWFWLLLPKQKDFGCRDETRQCSINQLFQ